jgi:arylsulfatase A-like enzyme
MFYFYLTEIFMDYLFFTTSTIVISSTMGVLSAAEKPNIIYINADDYGVMDTHYSGRKEYNTPNIDKLASEGMIFTNAYAPAANCAPSRACCMSGQYGPRHGIFTVGSSSRGSKYLRKLIPIKNRTILSDENITMAEALHAAGYTTIHLGKWHLGKDPKTQGFDVNIGGDHTGSPAGGYFAPFKKGPMKRYNDQYPKGTHLTDIFADQAAKFIKGHKDKPFFMYMAYYSVHGPLQPVPEFIDKYKNVPNLNHVYASMVEKMDEGIGKIMRTLDKLGLTDNTLVLFTSDNGAICKTSVQHPYRAGKGSYFEGGIRVPLCVRWPEKVKPGTKCDVPVIGIDFYPTFLAAAGAEIPKGKVLDGVNLMPLLSQSGTIAKRALYFHFPIYLQAYDGIRDESHDLFFRTRPGSVVIYGNWKLHEYFENGDLELFNLSEDIGERKNIASKMPEKAQELYAMMKNWRTKVKAPVPTKLNPCYNPDKAGTKRGKKKR